MIDLCTFDDPVDPKKKTADCNYCGCRYSQMYGRHSYSQMYSRHSYYNGKCLQCGKTE